MRPPGGGAGGGPAPFPRILTAAPRGALPGAARCPGVAAPVGSARIVRVWSDRFSVPSLGGVRLHALRYGDPDRRPLVLLHGGGANARWWDHLAPALARHFHVVALDFRGHGGSDFSEPVPGAFADDLAAVLEHLKARDAVLVGHSMGGHVALERAATAGDVRALALLDIGWGGAPRAGRAVRRVLRAARRSFATRDEALRRYAFVPAAPHAGEELRRHIAWHSVREHPDGRFGYAFDARWFDLPPRRPPDVREVRCPVLLVRGAESAILSVEGAAALQEAIPDASLVEIPGAGHHVHLDRPGAVLEALLTFLEPHGGERAAGML